MATKDAKARDDEDDDRDDDDPDAGVPVPAKGPAVKAGKKRAGKSASAKSARAASTSASAKVADQGHGDPHHGHDDATDDESQDPSWWLPYAVLGGLVLVGVLGFFGAFTTALKPMFSPLPKSSAAAEPAAAHEAPAEPIRPTTRPPTAAPEAETFGAKHLLVMHKESRRAPPTITRTKEEALARAKEALAKARAPGAKFESLVEEYSDEPGASKRGGNLGNFRRGAMVKEFQEGIEKTKVGEVSDIVETPFGYHVILRTK